MRRQRRPFARVVARGGSGPQNEAQVQALLCEWLSRHLPKSWRYFAVPNGVALGGSVVSRVRRINALKRTGLTRGVPDLILVRRDGSAWIGAEVKFANRPTTPEQQEWMRWSGGTIGVVNSIDTLADLLRRHGVEVPE